MLSHLVIRNFAIIHHLEIPFFEGLTVLSGETGAGKSIIINALNLLLGGRASADVIRNDEDKAVVEGSFELEGPTRVNIERVLEDLDIEMADGQLVIRRVVSRKGQNKVFINGSMSTVSTLKNLTEGLIDISGQHEHYSLMHPDRHLDILDDFGALGELRDRMGAEFSKVRAFRSELRALQNTVRDRLLRIDFLKFQLTEIDAAELRPGEDETLEKELKLLKNAERIADAARLAALMTYDAEKSAAERLGDAEAALFKVATYDDDLESIFRRVKEARVAVEEIARDISIFGQRVNVDPGRLDRLIERGETIKKLKKKHGFDIQIILDEARAMREELDLLENAEERGAELEAKLVKAEQLAFETAAELSAERRAAARVLARATESELGALNMARTQFIVDFEPKEIPVKASDARLDPRGLDQVEFLLAANLGEEPKPLSKIASGGELSRIMLSIKTVLADRDTISTYVFDEVDTGIGGSTADMVGNKIANTADSHQVLCITHLPQIASRGKHHYLVEKTTVGERTESQIRPLTKEERIEEIARMLGGARVTAKTREAAAELLGH